MDALYSEVQVKRVKGKLTCGFLLVPNCGYKYEWIPLDKTIFLKSNTIHKGSWLPWDDFVDAVYYYVSGTPGNPGGNSGLGGRGGYSGFDGEYFFIAQNSGIFKKPRNINKINGEPGISGEAGLGGLSGAKAIRRFKRVDPFKIIEIEIHPLEASNIISLFNIKRLINLYKMLTSSEILESFQEKYDYMENSSNRAENGTYSFERNLIGQTNPNKTEIEYYKEKNEYLKFLSELSKTKLKESKLMESAFVNFLIMAPELKPEIKDLVKSVTLFSIPEHHHILPSLKKRLEEYRKEFDDMKDKIVLNYTIGAISSLILRHKSERESVLVVDLKGFLEVTKEHLRAWETITQQNIKEVYRKNYENNLKRKIEEAYAFVDGLQNDIKIRNNDINQSLQKILRELTAIKENKHKNDANLLEKKKHLEDALFMKSFFGALTIFSSLLSFLGPKGVLIGTVLQAGVGIAEKIVNKEGKNKLSSIIDNSKNITNSISSFLKEENKKKLEKLENDVKVLEMIDNIGRGSFRAESGSRPIVDLKLIEKKIYNLADSIQKQELQLRFYENLKEDGNQAIENFDKKLISAKQLLNKTKNRENNLIKYSQVSINTAKIALQVYEEVEGSKDEIELIRGQIEANAHSYKQINEFEDKIIDFQTKNLRLFESDLNNIKLDGKSLAAIDFLKYEVKERLDNFKNQIINLIGSFDGKNEIMNTISRIENALTSTIDIYTRIESYNEQTEFANYIAHLTQKEVLIGIPSDYRSDINSLKRTIHANIIKERFQKALEAFEYWSFPFFCEHNDDLKINKIDEKTEDTNLMIKTYAEILTQLLEKVKTSENEITTAVDNHIQRFSFENEYPFFEWSSHKHPFEIKQLLNGNKTTLYADIKAAQYDAIKFCTLYILIEIKTNKSLNDQLTSILKNYFVELTHSGISNYKYKLKEFSINLNYNSAEKLLLRYKYGSSGSDDANASYQKLAYNKPVLSPYTFWEIKLNPIDKNDHLEKISSIILTEKDEIVVSLNGKGQYVTDEVKQSNCKHNKRNTKKTKECNFNDVYGKLIKKTD